MKKALILFTLILSFASLTAESNEPCKGVLVPSEMQASKVIFEIPRYDEYVHGIVIQSMTTGVTVDEKNILDEVTYSKIRNAQIQSIKANYTGDFEIMSSRKIKSEGISSGFLFQEKIISDLVTEKNIKFEQYTNFSIKNLSTSTLYTLVDPSKDASANCIVKKGEYKFDDLISVIQK